MKKNIFITTVCLLVYSVSTWGQLAKFPPSLQNYSVKAAKHYVNKYSQKIGENSLLLNKSALFVEEEIGQTVYDIQSFGSNNHKIYAYPDGTIGLVWASATGSPFPNIPAVGYNYFNGVNWNIPPLGEIVSANSGWPSYSHLGSAGEIVLSHDSLNLVMSQRLIKGSGPWVQASVPSSGIHPKWAKVCTAGNTIHILASDTVAYMGQSNPLVYYRSPDGGLTWDINQQMFSQIDSAAGYVNGFGPDMYEWAEPMGNTIAFVVGSKTTDLILMKSTDAGNNWTKTLIFQHPYPNFIDSLTLTPDSPFVCDGAHSVAFDLSGNANVVFGISRIVNDDTSDGTYSWFPYVDGIAYWKEGNPTFTDMNPETVFNSGKLIGYIQDTDSNGFIIIPYPLLVDLGDYQVGTSSQPQITIANGSIFVVYKSIVKNQQATNGQFYNHLFGRQSDDGGNTWGLFHELTTGIDHELVECVYPAMSKSSNGVIHLWYQSDFQPGTAFGPDQDPLCTNSIFFNNHSYTEFAMHLAGKSELVMSEIFSIFPNPATDFLNLQINSFKQSNVTIRIYDSIGELVKIENIVTGRGETKQINLSNLPKGIYLAKFETEDGTYTKKIVKQ